MLADTTDNFPKEFCERLAYIELVYVAGPSCMFVHLKSHLGALDAMQDSLEGAVKNQPKMEDIKAGRFVACHVLRPSNGGPSSSYWARGIVKCAAREANTYKVSYNLKPELKSEKIYCANY